MATLVQSDGSAQEARSPASIAWIAGFFFAFRAVVLLVSVRFFGMEPSTGAGAELALNFLLFAAVLVDKIGRPILPAQAFSHMPERRWVFCFLILSGCSLAWSVTTSMSAAMAFWCAMAADTGIVLLLVHIYPVEKVLTDLMKGFVCGACLVAFIAWILPAQSDLRLGDEQLLGPNQIAYACAFAIFFSQYLARIVGSSWSWATALLSVTTFRTLSKTTIIALLVAQTYLFLWDRTLTRKTRILMLSGAALTIVVFSGLISSYLDIYTSAGNQAETLTGRLGLWAIFLDESLQHPWIGHGFHSAWKVIPPFGPDQFEARHAHNELLQQFYAYGALGITVLLGLYRSFFRTVRGLPKGHLRTLLLSLFIFVVIRGLADTEPFDLSLPLWAIVLFSYRIESHAKEPSSALLLHPQGTFPALSPDVASGG